MKGLFCLVCLLICVVGISDGAVPVYRVDFNPDILLKGRNVDTMLRWRRRRSAFLSDEALQDCILKDLNCPADGSLDFRRARTVFKMVRSLDLPDSCNCSSEASDESCLRRCLYNYMVKSSVLSAVWYALRAGKDAEAANQTAVQTMETLFKPCVLGVEGCELAGIKTNISIAEMTSKLSQLRILVDSPSACNCDIDEDNLCARPCFYAIARKYREAGISIP